MSKYNADSVYGTLFVMLDEFSESDQNYLMENVFTESFLNNIRDNPSKAYNVLDGIVQNIETNKTDKVTELLSKYADKLYMMKAMLKDYGDFKENKEMKKLRKHLKEDSLNLSLSELANYLYLFGNDCRLLHLYARDENFLSIHEALQDLYEIAFDFYDFACESAIAHGEPIINPSLLYTVLANEWTPIEGNSFSQEEVVSYVLTNGKNILNCISNLKTYESWVQSGVDGYAEDLDKLISYKFSRMN